MKYKIKPSECKFLEGKWCDWEGRKCATVRADICLYALGKDPKAEASE